MLAAQIAQAAPVDRVRVERALDRAYAGIDPTRSLTERIWEAIGRFIQRAIEELIKVEGIGEVALLVFAVALVALIVWLVRRVLVPERRAPRRTLEDETIDWRARVEEALARGDLDAAVHAQYRVLLGALEARGVLAPRPSITAGEARSVVQAHLPEAFGAVSGATEIFERVAYGMRKPQLDELEQMRRAEEALTR